MSERFGAIACVAYCAVVFGVAVAGVVVLGGLWRGFSAVMSVLALVCLWAIHSELLTAIQKRGKR